jgi:hypothetical protein
VVALGQRALRAAPASVVAPLQRAPIQLAPLPFYFGVCRPVSTPASSVPLAVAGASGIIAGALLLGSAGGGDQAALS